VGKAAISHAAFLWGPRRQWYNTTTAGPAGRGPSPTPLPLPVSMRRAFRFALIYLSIASAVSFFLSARSYIAISSLSLAAAAAAWFRYVRSYPPRSPAVPGLRSRVYSRACEERRESRGPYARNKSELRLFRRAALSPAISVTIV